MSNVLALSSVEWEGGEKIGEKVWFLSLSFADADLAVFVSMHISLDCLWSAERFYVAGSIRMALCCSLGHSEGSQLHSAEIQ